MKFAAGTRIGPYEVISALGAGGMGEVYRARDTTLDRAVALKILPDAFASDADRVARFEREAKTLAALNHPHIAQIYGFEHGPAEAGPHNRALVMELVEGEDLAQRIVRGALPIDDALTIAAQIARALEAAHGQGIVHRDLKPSNIKLRADGTVKVLDFGLAKAFEPDSGDESQRSDGLANSPTITTPAMTLRGVILGTAAYMSPEQAKGNRVDKGADIWAFGCVLYEMLTARRAFEGDDTSETLAAVLRGDPDWAALPAATPPAIAKLLRRCLTKDGTRRLADIADARIEIDDALAAPRADLTAAGARFTSRRRAALLTVATAVLFTSIGALVALRFAPAPAARPGRLVIVLPSGVQLRAIGRSLAISRDGSQVVLTTSDGLYVRPLDGFEARPIAGVDRAMGALNPTFSPDGRSVAFWSPRDRTIRTVPTNGGPPITLGATPREGLEILNTLSWEVDGVLVAEGSAGITRFSPIGGHRQVVVRVADREAAVSSQLLPDGEHVLFTLLTGRALTRGLYASGQIVVQSMKTGARKTVIENGTDAQYVPTGHVVYARNAVLFSVPFDVRRLEVDGPATAVVEGVRTASVITATAQYSVSENGTLIYLPGRASMAALGFVDLALFDRNGGVQRLKVPSGPYEAPRVSPDGTRVAFSSDDGKEASIWVYDLAETTSMRRLTLGGRNRFPVWSADGERIAFQSDREGDLAIFWQRADGSGRAERLTRAEAGGAHAPESWAPSGSHLLYTVTDTKQTVTLGALSLRERRAEPFGNVTSATPTGAVFSRDGRWVAYSTTQPDRPTAIVYVQPFPATGATYQISRDDDGHHPIWSRDGSELVYVPGPGQLLAVKITTTPAFGVSSPVSIAPAGLQGPPTVTRNADVTKDGRVIGLVPFGDEQGAGGTVPRIHVVLNWFEELKRRH